MKVESQVSAEGTDKCFQNSNHTLFTLSEAIKSEIGFRQTPSLLLALYLDHLTNARPDTRPIPGKHYRNPTIVIWKLYSANLTKSSGIIEEVLNSFEKFCGGTNYKINNNKC